MEEVRVHGTGLRVEIDSRGGVVSGEEVTRRGLLVIGRLVQSDRERRRRSGLRVAPLGVTEARALLVAEEVDLKASR